MNESSTIVIGDADEERTLVDHRFSLADPEPPFEGSGSAVSSDSQSVSAHGPNEASRAKWQAVAMLLSGQKRRLVEIVTVLAVLLGLGSLAYQQSQVADALRETIEEIRTVQKGSHAHSIVEPGNRKLSPDGPETTREARTMEGAAKEREALERRGADLIASNDFSGALPHYEMLTQLFHESEAFRDVVAVLKAKLRCDRLDGLASDACL
jgi:hypothetical protein